MSIERVCQQCEKPFTVRQIGKFNPAKFCSKKCHYDSLRIKDEKILCKQCGNEFIVEGQRLKDKNRGQFCSSECHKLYRKINGTITRICPECGKEFTFLKNQLKFSPHNFCSRQCKSKSRIFKDRTKLTIYTRNHSQWNREKYGSWCRFSLIYKKKYNMTCMLTGFVTKNPIELQPHHIISVNINPDLCFEESNLILIKKDIHKHFHHLYGNKTTDKEWNEYLSIYYPEKIRKEITNILIFPQQVIAQ
jgi:endogenous inhibitor of DNA gyrase (YacG/DUF329 family)